jgi:hypothetical protein
VALDLELKTMSTTRKKMIAVALCSWLACLMTVLAAIFVFDGWTLSIPDLIGATTVTLAASLLTIALLYAPGLFWLRRRQGGCEPAHWFPLSAALILNAPLFLISALMAGRSMVVTEAFIFMAAFVVLGATFGLGFVLVYRDERLIESS